MDIYFAMPPFWCSVLLWCSIYLLSHDCAKRDFILRQKMMTCINMAMQKKQVICLFQKIFHRPVAPITTQSKYIFSAPSLIPPSTIPLEEVILCLKMNKRREWAIIPARMHLVRSFYSAKSLFALFSFSALDCHLH